MNAIVPASQATVPETTVTDHFLAMVERASRDPSVDLAKLERLLDLRAQEHARVAAQRYREAMAAAQAEMEPVRANCRNDQTRSRYASLDAVDAAVRPIYTRHGFSVSFDTADCERTDCIRVVCRVFHSDGHTEAHHIDMPCDGKGIKGNSMMTTTHAVASAISYARRYLLGMIFGIAVDKDDDGNAAGRRPAPQTVRPAPGRRANDHREHPHGPQTGEGTEWHRAESSSPDALVEDFHALREEMISIHSDGDLAEWAKLNFNRLNCQPAACKAVLRTLYVNRLAVLRQPAVAAE